MKRAQAIAPITSLQPPYAVVRREIEQEILPFCLSQNIGVIVYSPMYAGLLTGAMTKESVASFPARRLAPKSAGLQGADVVPQFASRRALAEYWRRRGRGPGEVAIAWTLNHPAVTGAIVGFRSAKQVEGIIGAADFRLNQERNRRD